jgi:hypothetical protein
LISQIGLKSAYSQFPSSVRVYVDTSCFVVAAVAVAVAVVAAAAAAPVAVAVAVGMFARPLLNEAV